MSKRVEDLAEKKDVEGLINALQSSKEVSSAAKEALFELGPELVIAPLINKLKTLDEPEQKSIIYALGKFDDPIAIDAILDCTRYPGHSYIRTDIVLSLRKVGEKGLDYLYQKLVEIYLRKDETAIGKENISKLDMILTVLSDKKDERVIPVLKEIILNEENKYIVISALERAKRFSKEELFNTLLEKIPKFGGYNDELIAALNTIRLYKDSRVVDILLPLLDFVNEKGRTHLAYILKEYTDPDSVKKITEYAEKSTRFPKSVILLALGIKETSQQNNEDMQLIITKGNMAVSIEAKDRLISQPPEMIAKDVLDILEYKNIHRIIGYASYRDLLVHCKDQLLDPLLERLQSVDEDEKNPIITALTLMGVEEIYDLVVEEFKRPWYPSRTARFPSVVQNIHGKMIEYFTQIGKTEAINPLLERYEDIKTTMNMNDYRIRKVVDAIPKALDTLKYPDLLNFLICEVNDETYANKFEIYKLLGSIQDEQAIKTLIDEINKKPRMYDSITHSIIRLGFNYREVIEREIPKSNLETQQILILILGIINDNNSLEFLKEIQKNCSEALSLYISYALLAFERTEVEDREILNKKICEIFVSRFNTSNHLKLEKNNHANASSSNETSVTFEEIFDIICNHTEEDDLVLYRKYPTSINVDLFRLLSIHRDSTIKVASIESLEYLGEEALCSLLFKTKSDYSYTNSCLALMSIVNQQREETVPIFLEMIKDVHKSKHILKIANFDKLAEYFGNNIDKLVSELHRTKGPEYCMIGLNILEHIDTKESVRLMVDFSNDESSTCRHYAKQLLQQSKSELYAEMLSEELTEELTEVLSDKKGAKDLTSITGYSIYSLVDIVDPSKISEVAKKLFKNEHMDMKEREILHGFMLQHDVSFYDNMVELISDDNPFIRMDTASLIGKSKETRFLAYLEKLFKDEEFPVRVEAVKAWCKINGIADWKHHEIISEKLNKTV
ncbi:MAG: hypothetical protein ACTSQF_04840 [Candidatus Heimdallarchaeaceae archaeon]